MDEEDLAEMREDQKLVDNTEEMDLNRAIQSGQDGGVGYDPQKVNQQCTKLIQLQ
jgi:hypothetical protein